MKVGFRLGAPGPGELGVRDGVLVDNAFAAELPLAPAGGVPVAGPVGVLNALAAAALARAVGYPPGRSPRRWPTSTSAGTAPRSWLSPAA